MSEEQIRKIFEETAKEFDGSAKYTEIVKKFEETAEKYSRDVATVETAFELSRQFTFEVLKKIFVRQTY